jgi:O-antigen/teichoic acid export membrane protein
LSLDSLFEKLGIKSERTKNISKQTLISFGFKGASILISLITVPITINYLDKANYGIWLTLTSFIGWFTFFDMGFGHGLRNKFTEAKTKGNDEMVRTYVSTAYFSLAGIAAFLIILFLIFNSFIDWSYVFNTDESLKQDLSKLMIIVFSFFSIRIVANLITTLYLADQKPSFTNIVGFSTQFVSLLVIIILTKTTSSSLFLFGSIVSIVPILILIIVNFIGFNKNFAKYVPSLKYWKFGQVKEILGLGSKFFVIQIAAIILFTTDNMIISQLFGPEEVTPYSIAFKYFSIITMVFAIIVAPYWSAITQAYASNDFSWIKTSMKNLLKISMALSLVVLVMLLFSEKMYYIWVGNMVQIPFLVSIFMATYVIMGLFGKPFNHFVNGTGKIKVQLIFAIFGAIINIPLSVFFARNLGMGISGVILGTISSDFIGLILLPIQYSKIINKKAHGIWNA